MIYLAIVGTSHLTENEEMDAHKIIIWKIREQLEKAFDIVNFSIHPHPLTIITGDAKGIDTIVRQIAVEQGIRVKIFEAETKNWEGFKKRNIQIASSAHYIISITTPIKREACYHCREPHQRTGGCWTRKYAFDKFGTPGETIVI